MSRARYPNQIGPQEVHVRVPGKADLAVEREFWRRLLRCLAENSIRFDDPG